MEYIKLLLADDEPIILRGLKKLVSWEQLGIRIVAEANDGIELRDLIARHNPQLIISDISMPGGSGIDVITELNEQGYSGKVIFISAFQEFGYARQAIQLGALDYLVKPINKVQLERVVGKAVSMIRETSDGERNKKMLNYYEEKNRANTIEKLLDGLLDGDTNTILDLTQLGVIVVSRFTTVCVLEMDDYADTSRWEDRERHLVNFAVSNIIRETLDQEPVMGKGLLVQKEGLSTILVQHEEKDYPLQLAQDLRHKIQQYLKLSVSCGVGTNKAGLEKAEETYREALKALHSKFFMGTNQVIRFGEADTEANKENRPITVLQSHLVKALTAMEREKIEPLIKELLEQIRIQAGNNKNLALTGVYNAVLTLIQELEKFGGELEGDQGGLLERWNDCLSYADVAQEVEAMLTEMQQKLASKVSGKERALLTKVKSYIEENYDSNITLESMAALVYMNSYYFSSFFKKHTGQNFKNYVTEVRMSHALKLLMETELLVYEIADRVGYNNVRHFSDMFKKRYGKVPQDYRQSFRQFET
ncbi:response regulator transcription factor [Paenibacillus sp. 7523-1]|uniref:response regulator transcription factor n=1 Tax=Paenibacillus sp. 7523-1 TaxID=2022550 RepID=UPI000BA66436|nr:response regulator [Paenibacillus sp. 7523-1]PAD32226.1 two-component system response regulator [Paenibacillus sp. 7523-1]